MCMQNLVNRCLTNLLQLLDLYSVVSCLNLFRVQAFFSSLMNTDIKNTALELWVERGTKTTQLYGNAPVKPFALHYMKANCRFRLRNFP